MSSRISTCPIRREVSWTAVINPRCRAKPISRRATFVEIHESSTLAISIFRGLAKGNGGLRSPFITPLAPTRVEYLLS
jgi:hypothetical protein